MTKHPNILGFPSTEALRAALRTDDALNQAASDALKNIMRNGTKTSRIHPKWGPVTEYMLPDGKGVRFVESTNQLIFLGRGIAP